MSELNCYKSQKTSHQALRVMWQHRDPSLCRSGKGNIFIKNLHPTIDSKALFETFAQFGTILSSKVATNSCGQSLGHGFVHFETQHAASMAIEVVNGMELMNKEVYVGDFVPKYLRKPATCSAKQFTNVYLKNLNADYLTYGKLRELLSAYAPVTSTYIPTTPENTPLGYAFVNFQSIEMAERAVAEMNNKPIDGRALYVGRARKRTERNAIPREQYTGSAREHNVKRRGRKLYVKHLPVELDEAALENDFSPYGAVKRCIIVRDCSGASRGFGFVSFPSAPEATKAMNQLNGTLLGDSETPIFIEMARRKMQLQSSQQNNPHHIPTMPQMYQVHPVPSLNPRQWISYQYNGCHVPNFFSMNHNMNNFAPPPTITPRSSQIGSHPTAHQVAQMNHPCNYDASSQQYASMKPI